MWMKVQYFGKARMVHYLFDRSRRHDEAFTVIKSVKCFTKTSPKLLHDCIR